MQDTDLMTRIRIRTDLISQRIRNHIVTQAGCWEYQGQRSSTGYGAMTICARGMKPYRRKFVASRVSYAFHNNADPGKFMVCHKCDNPACINPAHLFLGSAADNSADMVAKGRSLPQAGAANFAAKLGDEEVREVITQLKQGKTNKAIAAKAGVSHAMISMIRTGKAWQGVASEMQYQPKPCFRRGASQR